jgi:hypothetical protein
MGRQEPSWRSVGLRHGHLQDFSDSLEKKEEFSEVRGYKLPRLALAIYQSRRGRATFSLLPRP